MYRFMIKSAVAAAIAISSMSVSAAPILFVSDSNTDLSIAQALTNAGYTVTSATGQYDEQNGGTTTALLGQLSSYAAVYWSATGYNFGDLNANANMLTNLINYVTAGGNVFVTGYDSIVSPYDTALQSFLGGSSGVDSCGAPGVISASANSLTTGVTDIRGATPTTPDSQTCDRDGLGGLSADTVGVVGDGQYNGYYQWTLRNLGLGQIAYVSNGNPDGETPQWTDGSVYQAAVLNFAANAAPAEVPEPAMLGLVGLGLAGVALSRRKKRTAAL